MSDIHPLIMLPGASIWELGYTGGALLASLIQLYTIISLSQSVKVLRRLPGSRDAYLMAISSLGNVIGRMIIALLIIWAGIEAIQTKPLILPIPWIARQASIVFFAISVQLSILSIREIVYRAAAIRAGRQAREGIIDSSRDALLVIDPNGEIKSVNRAAGRLFGYTPEEMQGRSITDMMPHRYRAAHTKGIARYLREGKSTVLGRPIIVDILTKAGIEEAVELIITETRGRNSTLFTGIMRPVNLPEAASDVAMEGSYVGKAHSSIPPKEG